MSLEALKDRVVVITGASSGFGLAMAKAFAREGCRLAIGARRHEKVEELAREIEKTCGVPCLASELDVTQRKSVDSFIERVEKRFARIDVLINNAGLALGLDPVSRFDEEAFERMFQTNVGGVLRTSRAALRLIERQPEGGMIINIGSVAGHFSYENGSIYAGTKHAVRAITQALRFEVNGKPIRVGSIDPGMAETEFSQVRFQGDAERAKQVYSGMRPLVAEDIAECAVFMASRPPHVNIDEMLLMPTDQTIPAQMKVHRRG